MKDKIAALHSAWNTATGQHIPLGVCSYEVECGWLNFIKAGYGEEDLITVVAYLQAEIKKGERKPASLRWRNCVGDTLRFSEEIELARGAMKRKVTETPRSRAILQLRPRAVATTPEETRNTAVPVSELIANLKRAAGMRVS